MTRSACFVFDVREPLDLRWYWPEEGYRSDSPERLYFDLESQSKAFEERVAKAYLPSNEILADLVDAGAKFSLRLDGGFLDLCRDNDTALASFKELARSGGIELLGAPYYSTLSCFFDRFDEFKAIVGMHKEALRSLFGRPPSTFANSGLIFQSRIGHIVKGMGFTRALVGGLKEGFGYRTESGVMALPVHAQLSSDLEARFSDHEWSCYPLSADKYASWIARTPGDLAVVYVNYGAFGVIHPAKSGIFEFLRSLPGALEERGVSMIVPSEYECPEIEYSGFYDTASMTPVTSVLGNHMQHLYFNEIKRMQREIDRCPAAYLEIWRRLQTTDILEDMASVRPWHPWDKAVSNMLLLSDFKRRVIGAMR
jgi:alpha-amylase